MRKPRDESFVTIKHVASKANVSIATVSRVMNNGRVSAKRRKLVMKAMEELNYVPNNSARNLASTKTTKRIRIIVPNVSLPCYNTLVKGFEVGAQLYRYESEKVEYNFDDEEYSAINMNAFATSEVKGIVQVGHHEDIINKIVVSLDDNLLQLKPSSAYDGKKIGFYFPKDEFLSSFFSDYIFVKNKTTNLCETMDKNLDLYITQTIEGAAKLINLGVTKEIRVLDNVDELSKIVPNISEMSIDFYAIGVIISRITIKKIIGSPTIDKDVLVINIK